MVLLIYGVRLPPLCQKPHINLLGRVTDQVFSESEEWDIDTVSETIASEYERATNLSINKEKQNLPIEEKRTIDVKEIREWLNFIITIISVVLGVTNSSATTINNYNYTQQVNNYYIVGMGYDAKELNTTKYRIVNRESIVRLKHDCHSIVIEKLEEGKVVRIIDKYKKWRQIIWENEDGEECMGWIQNYRLTEFKVPRNKRCIFDEIESISEGSIMCGRYYIDSDMADEIEKVVHDIDQRIRQEHFAGDIFPTNVAPIIEKSEHGLKLDVCKWGYPLSQGKNLVINARAESVMDKPSFRNGILYHRILIPASGFYEWNRLKEKNTFSRYDAPVLYMAGFCDWFENERRFVIMTTAANESMIKVHDRMPLILEKGQLKDWFDDRKMEQILHQVPVQLKREAEYEQQSLFL